MHGSRSHLGSLLSGAGRLRAAFWLFSVALLSQPLPCRAITVTSADELGLADFWIYVEGSDGGLARVEARDDEPVSIEIENPVVAGVQLEGHLNLSANAEASGPATRVNAVLNSAASAAIDSDVDLFSYIAFDLAVLSSSQDSAEVKVVGMGIGGAAGTQGDGGPNFSWSSSSGYVTLYESNASGGFGPIVQYWEVRGNFSSTLIDDTVTLSTNVLYKIIVRSQANIDILAPPTLEQYAYLYVDPQLALTTLDPDLELVVSSNLPEAIPEPRAGALAATASLVLAVLARRQRARAARR